MKYPGVDKNYFSPGGIKFSSVKRVQEHCEFWGIPILTPEDAVVYSKVSFSPLSLLEIWGRLRVQYCPLFTVITELSKSRISCSH